MGKETNFDPDILESAFKELQALQKLVENHPALGRLGEISQIQGDLAGMKDSNGGWYALETHIGDITKYVGKITNDIKAESAILQARMRNSIDTLKGADDGNKQGLDKSKQTIQSGAQH